MTFLDDIGEKVSGAAVTATQKAKALSEIAKFGAMISEEEKKIDKLYQEIGSRYFSAHKDDPEEEFAELTQQICLSKEVIAEYKENIMELKGIMLCPDCGAEVPKGDTFCSSCGLRMPREDAPLPEGSIRCSRCGAVLKEGTHFCTVCGTKISQTEEAEELPLPEEIMQPEEIVMPEEVPLPEELLLPEEDAVPEEIPLPEELPIPESVLTFDPEPILMEEELPIPESVLMHDAVQQPVKRVCPVCGSPVGEECVFCTECGTRLEDEVSSVPSERICRRCGAELSADALFCTECGMRV